MINKALCGIPKPMLPIAADSAANLPRKPGDCPAGTVGNGRVNIVKIAFEHTDSILKGADFVFQQFIFTLYLKKRIRFAVHQFTCG